MKMNVNEIRRINVIAMISRQYNGIAADFARAIERSDSQVSQWITGGEKGRSIGEKSARHIEKQCDLPRGTLDHPDMQIAAPAARQPLGLYRIDPVIQSRVLELFDKLTKHQQSQFLQEIEAAASANEVIIREVGNRLCPTDDETVGRHLPTVPVSKK
jgi:hypothetical protein